MLCRRYFHEDGSWMPEHISFESKSLVTVLPVWNFWLISSIYSSGCNEIACRKMRLVLGHFLSCSRKNKNDHQGSGQGCHLCAQLINIVGLHSRHLCRWVSDILLTGLLTFYVTWNKCQSNIKPTEQVIILPKASKLIVLRLIVLTKHVFFIEQMLIDEPLYLNRFPLNNSDHTKC